jgi:hypothetical protein
MRIEVNQRCVWESADQPSGTGSVVLSLFDSAGRQLANVRLEIELHDLVSLSLRQLTPAGEGILRRLILPHHP